MITNEIEALLKLRSYLLETIVQCADEIADIDRKLAIIQSQELETDLNQAAEKAKT